MKELAYLIAALAFMVLVILSVAIWIRAKFGDPPE